MWSDLLWPRQLSSEVAAADLVRIEGSFSRPQLFRCRQRYFGVGVFVSNGTSVSGFSFDLLCVFGEGLIRSSGGSSLQGGDLPCVVDEG